MGDQATGPIDKKGKKKPPNLKSKCGQCGKQASKKPEDWVCCCSCEQWFHMPCTGCKKYLNVKIVNSMDEKFILFQCKVCIEENMVVGLKYKESVPRDCVNFKGINCKK